MMVPADAAVMTNGRPYVGLVAATAVALRVAKLSPSINDDAFHRASRKSRHELFAWLAVTSHQTHSETGDSALVYVFPSASSIRVFTPRSRRTARGVRLTCSRSEQRRGLLRSAPVGSRWTAVSGPLAQKTPTLLNR